MTRDWLIELALHRQREKSRDRAEAFEAERRAFGTTKPPTLSDVIRGLRGENSFDLYTSGPESVSIGQGILDQHGGVFGRTGGGKSRALLTMLLRRVDRALEHGERIELVVIDAKGETSDDLGCDFTERIIRGGTMARRLRNEVVVQTWTRERISPLPLIQRSTDVSSTYLAELKADVVSRVFSEWSDTLRFLLFQVIRTADEAELQFNLQSIEGLLMDEPFRSSVNEKLASSDLREFWRAFDNIVARQTIVAFLRRVMMLFANEQVRFAFGLPESYRSKIQRGPITLANTSTETLPPSVSLMVSCFLLIDTLLAATRRDPSSRLIIVIEEAAHLLAQSEPLRALFVDSLRLLRSRGVTVIFVAQSIEALPGPFVREVMTNLGWILSFAAGSDIARVIAPHVLPSPGDTRSEGERLRDFDRVLAGLPRQQAYFWARSHAAIPVRALDQPDPGAAIGLTRAEIQRHYDNLLVQPSTIGVDEARAVVDAERDRSTDARKKKAKRSAKPSDFFEDEEDSE
ncbi:MAG: hypothetical protein NDJ92_20995 [Thermoanaerobaculia bacterium]|nr:hypothetical protein [Thermoanaerobaculia bacterium]